MRVNEKEIKRKKNKEKDIKIEDDKKETDRLILKESDMEIK